MGLLDLPGPLFGFIDQVLGGILPTVVRLLLWGILAGWLTMIVYRALSNQDRIQVLKNEQKKQQKLIAEFDGEITELFPLIRHTLGLGMRQLGLSLGPALLATIPILFLVVWVAGAFGYHAPEAGLEVRVTISPAKAAADAAWAPASAASATDDGWVVRWPAEGETLSLQLDGQALVEFPLERPVPIIHEKQWWNWLMANPIGYLPEASGVDAVEFELPEQQVLAFGPGWMRGWMFTFFLSFLLASVAFKLILKID